MALNPDDLLIFKEREEKKAKKGAKAVQPPQVQAQKNETEAKPKQEQQAASKPVEQELQKPVKVQSQAVQKLERTQNLEKPKTQETSKAAGVFSRMIHNLEQPQKVEKPKVQEVAKPATPAPIVQKQEQKIAAEIIAVPKKAQPPVQHQAPQAAKPNEPPAHIESETMASIYASLQPNEGEIESIISGEFEHGGAGPVKRTTISRTEVQSRDAAKGLSCVWHPWRPAFAMCNYCNRPFCYEDIIEYKNNYYCLEDIDKVSTGAAVETSVKYNNLSMLSALLFIISFVVFIFAASGEVVFITHYANEVGFFTFLADINYTYAAALLGLFLSLFSIVAGILIFIHSGKSFAVGTTVGAFNVLLFSYSYISSREIYAVVISAISFVALLLLLLSREAYETEETLMPASSYQQVETVAGRF